MFSAKTTVQLRFFLLILVSLSLTATAATATSGTIGDFDGDGKADILWRNTSTGDTAIWLMNGLTATSQGVVATVDLAWQIAGVGDFNGDGKADILWRNTSTGDTAIWLMNGLTPTSQGVVATVDLAWQIAGVGDFNGDGKADILWRNTSTGDTAIWLMNGLTPTSQGVVATVDLAWQIAGVGDFNGDGKADILWRNTSTGDTAIWLMNGLTPTSQGVVATVDLAWQIAGVGDFNGDGKADILWRNTSTGDTAIWLMNGLSQSSQGVVATVDLAWQIAGVGDFNGDGKADILWRNTSTGDTAIWLMNGLSQSSQGVVATVDLAWQIVGGASSLSLSPSPGPLAPASAGVSYSGAINASGGGPNYSFTVNGMSVPTNGQPVGLSDGLGVTNTGGNTLTISGTPIGTATVTLSVSVTSNGITIGPVSYSITVSGQAGASINGNISLANCTNGSIGCGVAGVTVVLGPNAIASATTDNSGNFSFQNLTNGTYSLVPSITGPTSVFYPASYSSINVNGSPVNVSFQAALGYTVSGTFSYSGANMNGGQIYLYLLNQSGGYGWTQGTSVGCASGSCSGSFTIRGVPPGGYTLQAGMDVRSAGGYGVAFGIPNASNPNGSTPVTVSNANVTGASVALTDPAPPDLSAYTPQIKGVSPLDNNNANGVGALLTYKPITTNNNGMTLELATSYNIQWSTSATFSPLAGSTSIPAHGDNGPVILDGANAQRSLTGLTNGAQLYFRIQGADATSSSNWSSAIGPVTIGAPTGNLVTGSVTWPGSYTGNSTGPLYVGFYDMSTGNVYATSIESPTSPQSYSIEVPTGSNYFFFGVIDANHDGLIDNNNYAPSSLGDLANTGGNSGSGIAISGSTTMNLDLTPYAVNSSVNLTTSHSHSINPSGPPQNDTYGLGFDVRGLLKQPVAVALVSGNNVISPMDVAPCGSCGNGGEFQFWPSLATDAPNAGDPYGLQVTYADGSSETLPPTVGTVLNAFVTNPAPAGSASGQTQPTFTWSDPTNPSSYTYQFSLWGPNGTIWQIPGNNSKSNGFSSSITSITWGTDPTGDTNNTPSVPSLTSGTPYQWNLSTQDSSGNSAQTQVTFTP